MQDRASRAVTVILDAPTSALEGSVMAVRVRLAPGERALVASGEVTLTRTIAFRYRQENHDGATHLATARRSEVVALQPLPASPEVVRGEYDAEALLPVPAQGPPSADTELVSVDWTVRALLDVGGSRPAQAVAKVAVLTRAAAFDGAVVRPPHTDDRGHTVVEIDHLSTRRIAPGTRLRGDVVVAPLAPGRIRNVRLELVLIEHVPRGAAHRPDAVGSKDAASVVATVVLASGLQVSEDLGTVRLPFALDVPDPLRAPSVATPEFELGWTLRAVVSRPLHRDAYAELDLQAVTVAG